MVGLLRKAVELDSEGSDATDSDINYFIKLRLIPVLRDYVKNYGDRKGRIVLRARGYASVPASDAVLGEKISETFILEMYRKISRYILFRG